MYRIRDNKFKKLICFFMIIMLINISGFTVFADEMKVLPKIIFSINSKDTMFFDTEFLTEPKLAVNNAPAIMIEEGIYVPIREFAESLGISVNFDGEKNAIALGYENNVTELSSIKSYEDLSKEMVYFSLNGISYTKIENISNIQSLNIAGNDGVYILYKTLSPESNIDNAAWSNELTVEENQVKLTSKLVDNMKQNVVAPTENYGETLQKNYVSIPMEKYSTIVNPYVPYAYDQMVKDAQRLQEFFPEYIKLGTAGKSVEGRDLITIELGSGAKTVFITGSTHAREYISTSYIMTFIEKTALAAKTGENSTAYNIDQILKDVTYRIIPMVNPDGVNLVQNGIDSVSPEFREQVRAMPIVGGSKNGYRAWKSNIRGVDLNRNFPINWNIDPSEHYKVPSSMNFVGPSPASEPEVQAVMNYVDQFPPKAVIAVHTQGKIIYWSNPENQLGDINNKIIAASGFAQERTEDDGYLSNYVRGKYGVYEITLELCKYVGAYPYPDVDFDTVWSPAKDVCLIVADEISKRD